MATKTRRKSKGKAATKAAEPKSNGRSKMTDVQKAKLGEKVLKMRGQGKSWDEVKEATGIPGSITGRKLMRAAGGAKAEGAIRKLSTSGGKSKVKAGKSSKAKGKSSKARGGKATKKGKGSGNS